MTDSAQPIAVEPILLKDLAGALPQTRIFAETPFAAIAGHGRDIDRVERVTVKAGATLVEAGEPWRFYWLVLEGEIRTERPEPDGTWTLVGILHAGEGFGEVPLLTGRATAMFRVSAAQDSVLVRFSEQDFWSLLACCSSVRKTILADSAQRHSGLPG